MKRKENLKKQKPKNTKLSFSEGMNAQKTLPNMETIRNLLAGQKDNIQQATPNQENAVLKVIIYNGSKNYEEPKIYRYVW